MLNDKLLKIQCELKAPKNQRNNFGKYNYRSAEDILEAVKPLLKKYDCGLVLSDEMVLIGDRVYVKAIATFTDGDKEIVTTAYAKEPISQAGMSDSQLSGSASSYARKYCLNGLLLIDDTKDADTDEFHNETVARKSNVGLDFEELRKRYQNMTTEELRKEYVAAKTYQGWTDKQKDAICKMITKIQEERNENE